MIVLHANPVAGDNADDTHDLAEVAALGTVEVLFVGRQAAIGIVEIDHVAQRVQVIQRNAGRDLHRDEREKQTEVALARGWPDRFAPPPRAGDAPFARKPAAPGSDWFGAPALAQFPRQPAVDVVGKRLRQVLKAQAEPVPAIGNLDDQIRHRWRMQGHQTVPGQHELPVVGIGPRNTARALEFQYLGKRRGRNLRRRNSQRPKDAEQARQGDPATAIGEQVNQRGPGALKRNIQPCHRGPVPGCYERLADQALQIA